MGKKPIEVFKSKEQFLECCKEWQEKLFLRDWFIKYKLTEEELRDDDGNLLYGYCTHMMNDNSACITVCNKAEFPDVEDEMFLKPCAELTVIHELLHLQFEYSEAMSDADSEVLRATLTHASLERMAKTLLMTKYNLDREWFFIPEAKSKEEEDIIDLKDVAYGKS